MTWTPEKHAKLKMMLTGNVVDPDEMPEIMKEMLQEIERMKKAAHITNKHWREMADEFSNLKGFIDD